MSDYTPTLDELREVWGDRAVSREGRSTTQWRELSVVALAEFDRAIAQIKADAWQEGYDEFERAHNMSNYEPWEYAQDNPYRTP